MASRGHKASEQKASKQMRPPAIIAAILHLLEPLGDFSDEVSGCNGIEHLSRPKVPIKLPAMANYRKQCPDPEDAPPKAPRLLVIF